ncbi:MAG: hypothetical protein ACUVXA_18265 [Candidatus Jordarchaeum sp.]|uniref:hypothetical protein n=1 Tax=Candidatus Jordarchaeum sp. TaxID=2823881 RepID=UPI00404B5CA4
MSEKQSAIKDILTKIIKDTIQETVEPPIRTMIKSIQMIRDRLNELEASVENVITDQGVKIDKLGEELNILYSTVKNLKERSQETPNLPNTTVTQEKKPEIEVNSAEAQSVKTVNSAISKVETPTTESIEKVTKRKITEEKIRALFNKLEQGLPSPEEKTEAETITEKLSEEADTEEISPLPMQKIDKPAFKESIKSTDTSLTLEEEPSDVSVEEQEKELIFEEEVPAIPMTDSEELSSVEISTSELRTVLDDLTAELSELEIQRSDFERKLGDLAFDRMRGLITEEEYRLKTQELRQNLENISKRIDQIMERMRS